MTTSYRIIQLVKSKISNEYLKASDTDAAKALHISRAAVSAYKHGKDVMGLETFTLAATILQLDKAAISDYGLALLTELKPQARIVWDATKYMLDQAKNYGKLAGAVLVFAVCAHAGKSLAGTVDESTLYADQSIHYANSDFIHKIIMYLY